MRAIGAAASVLTCLAAGAAVASPHRASPTATLTLDGVWTNASYTQFERPFDVKHLIPTAEEAKALTARLDASEGIDEGGEVDPLGQTQSEFNEAGKRLARIRGQLRTSWIVSPSDGKVGYTDAAKRLFRWGPYKPASRYDNPEDRPDSERCLYANGSAPPQVSQQDSNVMVIVQTKDRVALFSEKNHDVRTIFIGMRPPNEAPSPSGNAYGRWEGSTLVVETKNFSHPVVDRFWFSFSGAATVTERFTRTGPTEILYEFVVNDPGILTEPVRGEMVFEPSEGPPYEYACHEGNYSLPSILQAARLGRQTPPPKSQPVTPAAKSPASAVAASAQAVP